MQVIHPASPGTTETQYRVRGLGVLLTYAGVADVAHWRRFVAHVKSKRRAWRVKHWCTTLEASKDANLHVHLMVQFASTVDVTTKRFLFESLVPNASTTDLFGEGRTGRNYQQTLDRGFFYVWADKTGTQRDEHGRECTTGNYEPC